MSRQYPYKAKPKFPPPLPHNSLDINQVLRYEQQHVRYTAQGQIVPVNVLSSNSNSSSSTNTTTTLSIATTTEQARSWYTFHQQNHPSFKKFKLFFVKFYRGASDCILPNVCTIPLYSVPYKDRPRWFMVLAGSQTVASHAVPYEHVLDNEGRAAKPFPNYARMLKLKFIEHPMLEVAHPSVVCDHFEFYSLGKDLAVGHPPTIYNTPLKIVPHFDFELHTQEFNEFRTYWNNKSLLAQVACPSQLDRIVLERYIAAIPMYRETLGFFTRYPTHSSVNNRKNRRQCLRGRALHPRPPVQRKPRHHAGSTTLSMLLANISKSETPEGRASLGKDPQGSLAWILERMLRISASRVSSFIGHGHYDLEKHPVKNTVQADCVIKQMSESVANLLMHPDKNASSKKMSWGTTREDILSKNTLLRLRMRERVINDFHEPIEFQALHSEFRDRLPFYSVSTDGNLFWGKNKEVESAFEFKNPTRVCIHCKPEYYDQIQLICGIKGLMYIDFCIGDPGTSTLQRVDFNPEYFEKIILPRAWQAMLFGYIPSLLYTLNYGCIPPWLDHPQMEEEDPTDPADVFSYDLHQLERAADTFIMPEEHETNIVPNVRDNTYAFPTNEGVYGAFEGLSKAHWNNEWKDERLRYGVMYPFIPFCFPEGPERMAKYREEQKAKQEQQKTSSSSISTKETTAAAADISVIASSCMFDHEDELFTDVEMREQEQIEKLFMQAKCDAGYHYISKTNNLLPTTTTTTASSSS